MVPFLLWGKGRTRHCVQTKHKSQETCECSRSRQTAETVSWLHVTEVKSFYCYDTRRQIRGVQWLQNVLFWGVCGSWVYISCYSRLMDALLQKAYSPVTLPRTCFLTSFRFISLQGIEMEIVDSCQDSNGGCSHHCEHTTAGPRCSCNDGYRLDFDGKMCAGNAWRMPHLCGRKEEVWWVSLQEEPAGELSLK